MFSQPVCECRFSHWDFEHLCTEKEVMTFLQWRDCSQRSRCVRNINLVSSGSLQKTSVDCAVVFSFGQVVVTHVNLRNSIKVQPCFSVGTPEAWCMHLGTWLHLILFWWDIVGIFFTVRGKVRRQLLLTNCLRRVGDSSSLSRDFYGWGVSSCFRLVVYRQNCNNFCE